MADDPEQPRLAASRLWPIAFWLLGLLMVFHPMILSGFQQMQTDPGDTRFNNYILEHGFRWLTGDPLHASFWNAPFFYPHPNVIAYSDVLLGTLPLYGIWRLLGFFPDTSFQLWMMTVLSLSFLAAYLWMTRGLRPLVRIGPFAASAGAFVFAFGSSRIAQLGHHQLLPHFFTITALHALTRVLVSLRLHPGGATTATPRETSTWIAVFFGSVALQLYAGFYLGWFLIFGLEVAAFWLVILALVSSKVRRESLRVLKQLVRHHWKVIVGSALISAAGLAPMAVHYLAAATEVGYRDFYGETVNMLPRFFSWFYLGPDSWLYSWQAHLATFGFPTPWEHEIGLGVVTTLTAIAGILFSLRRRPWVGFIAICAISIGLATAYYPGGVTFWRELLVLVPGGNAIRAIARVGLLMLVPVSIGVALTVQWIVAGPAPGALSEGTKAGSSVARRALAGTLVVLCVAEQGRTTRHYDKLETRERVDAIAARVKSSLPCVAFYYSPVGSPEETLHEWSTQPDAMWAQLRSGVPTINGYSGQFPREWVGRPRSLQRWPGLYDNRIQHPEDEPRIRAALDHWSSAEGLDPSRICWIRMPVTN